jgi:hypothetical protein
VCAVPFTSGGASRDRTDDPLLAKQVLSQLSYGPGWTFVAGKAREGEVGEKPMSLSATPPGAKVVGLGGLEPPASPLSGVRSNHLSYRPSVAIAPGFPPGLLRERMQVTCADA